jgi:fucose permease
MKINDGVAGGSSTIVLEMPETSHQPKSSEKDVPVLADISAGALPSPTTATPYLQKWNYPRINMWRCFAAFYSFIILGANDAAYGALIPYLEVYYNVNYTVISLVFLSPIVGYTMSALLNNHIHTVYGQRGVAWIMSVSHICAYTAIAVHPPYPVLVVVFILAGFGNGLGDSGWNAWVGDMANANEVLGFLHGFYGLGAALSPIIATALITKAGWQWYEFYYIMVGAACLECVVLVGAFWTSDSKAYRAEHPQAANVDLSGSSTPSNVSDDQDIGNQSRRSRLAKLSPFGKRGKGKSKTAEAVKNKVTLLASVFLLIYVGIEVSIGGWIVTFMRRVRHGTPFASGLVSTGFWLGITVGRLVLGFVTNRVFRSERLAVAFYLACCVALELLFWLIPSFVVSAVMVGFLGFFLAPLVSHCHLAKPNRGSQAFHANRYTQFPAAVVVLTKLLPKHLHVAAVGFAAAFGASGACVLPFAVGAIANAKGVKVLQPIILAALALCLGVWLLIPRLPKQRMA